MHGSNKTLCHIAIISDAKSFHRRVFPASKSLGGRYHKISCKLLVNISLITSYVLLFPPFPPPTSSTLLFLFLLQLFICSFFFPNSSTCMLDFCGSHWYPSRWFQSPLHFQAQENSKVNNVCEKQNTEN